MSICKKIFCSWGVFFLSLSWAVIAFVVWFFLAYFSTFFSVNFATYEELMKSGFLEKGWIPDFLPTDASDIKEAHDLDTNMRALSFLTRKQVRFHECFVDSKPTTEDLPKGKFVSWWPIALVAGRHTDFGGFKFKSCESDFIAYEEQKSGVRKYYFWNLGGTSWCSPAMKAKIGDKPDLCK